MSRIDDLVARLCPDGVEYKALGDVCVRQKGTPITAKRMKELDKPGAPVTIFAGGNTTAHVDFEDIPSKDIHCEASVIVKSRGNIGFEYFEGPFSHKNEMWSYRANSSDINLRFVYHYLLKHVDDFQHAAKSGKLPQISTPVTDNFLIPVPPLEIQDEIVQVLDSFTELEAELEARKAQYVCYLDKLLDFPRKVS